MPNRFGFGRKEKLKSRKQIDELFLNGKSFAAFPLRVTYQFFPSDEPSVQVGVTASKRYFKKAVDRNRLKRLMREAYRLQKSDLSETVKQRKLRVYLFFMYTDKTLTSFETVKSAMRSALDRLLKLLPES